MDLIMDVGMCRGDDTAHYLHKGYRVVGIEANPQLAQRITARFRSDIASGRLTVLNLGIAPTEGSATFWVSDHDEWSSFNRASASRAGTSVNPVEVECRPMDSILNEFGIPFYMKVDIEGNDRECVRCLTPDRRPQYLSIEIGPDSWRETLACVQRAGYGEFKIINQQTYTDAMPIQDGEYFARALRKMCTFAPALKPVARSIIVRQDFDTFLDRFAWTEWEGTSGPFAEDTFGSWQSADQIAARFASVALKMAHANRVSWFDLHAR